MRQGGLSPVPPRLSQNTHEERNGTNYKTLRTLSDGQQVLVGACEDVKKARKKRRGTELLARELRKSQWAFLKKAFTNI